MQPTLRPPSQKFVRLELMYPVVWKNARVSKVRPRLRASYQRRAHTTCEVVRVRRMRCTGGPRGTPWIDGERANARAEGDTMTASAIDGERLLADSIAGKFPDAQGRFGPFGGRYVPETLIPALERLEAGIRKHLHASAFQTEFQQQLKSWV